MMKWGNCKRYVLCRWDHLFLGKTKIHFSFTKTIWNGSFNNRTGYDAMGGVCMCMGKFANKRKASGCFFQGKETKTITNNIIFPNKNWAPWKRRLSHRGCPDTKAPNFCPPLPPGMSRCQGAHTLERGFLDVECPDTRAPKPWTAIPRIGEIAGQVLDALVPRHPAKGKSPVEDWTPSYHDTPHRCTPTHKGFHEGARANDGRALAFATAAEDCLFFRRVCRGWAGSKHHKEGLGLDQCRSKIKRHTKKWEIILHTEKPDAPRTLSVRTDVRENKCISTCNQIYERSDLFECLQTMFFENIGEQGHQVPIRIRQQICTN